MTAANFGFGESSSKAEPVDKLTPKLLTDKKIYYSERFIYLDKSEFGIVWHNVGLFIFLHAMWFQGIYGILTLDPEFIKCAPVALFFSVMSGFGVTCGAHRLWSHRTYKAKLPLRLFLILGHIIAGQNNLYVWCRDHRVHHKYSDTDADPHNTNRGFFFAHMGWLMYKKHPDVLVKGSKIDISDLKQDPLIRFQAKYYYQLYFLVNLVIPISFSMYVLGASLYSSFLYSYMLRYASALHSTWFVNSAAHMFGDKPYNEKIRPVENIYVSFFSIGEGYHNYHHTFPFDYATSEFSRFNIAKNFIELMAKCGLAYNLKRASANMVASTRSKVEQRLFKVNKEDENSEYSLEFVIGKKGHENKHANVHMKGTTNGHAIKSTTIDLNHENKIIAREELREEIEEIKNVQFKSGDQHRSDLNNNILRSIISESNEERKER